jgi:hypothetical protein
MSRHLLLLLGLVGCVDNDLPPGSFLDRDRVLGARIEVSGDVERASPMPGETVSVRWIMAEPGAQTRAWTLAVCVGTHSGCAAEPMLVETGTGFEPSLSLVAPAVEAGVDRLWIAGEIDANKVVATIPITLGSIEQANRNPSLADAALSIGDAPWSAGEEPAAEGCDASMPVLRIADVDVELAIDVDEADREMYTNFADDGSASTHREELLVSHFTSVGTLARQFSVLEETDSTVRVQWIAPDEVPLSGVVARFVIVLRDGRGGLDVTTRFACIVP